MSTITASKLDLISYVLEKDKTSCDTERKRKITSAEESTSKYTAFESEDRTSLEARNITPDSTTDQKVFNLVSAPYFQTLSTPPIEDSPTQPPPKKDLEVEGLDYLDTITLPERTFTQEELHELSRLPKAKYLQLLDPRVNLKPYIKQAINQRDFTTAVILAHKNGTINMKDVRGNSLLHLAGTYKDMRAMELCVKYKIDMDAVNHNSETALMNAAVDGEVDVIDFLLKAGADREISYSTHPDRKPSIIAYYKQRPLIMSLLPLHKEEYQRITLQELMFAFSLEDEAITAPSGSLWAYTHLANIATDPSIKEAFKKAANVDRDILEELANNEIVILEGGTIDHTMSLVFAKVQGHDVLVICNRGFGRNGQSIQYFAIDRKKIDEECLDTLEEYSTRSIEDSDVVEFFYADLPNLLASEDTSVEDHLEVLREVRTVKEQKVGNCTLAAPKAAAAAIVSIQIYNQHGDTLSLRKMQKLSLRRYKEEIGLPLRAYFARRALSSGVVIQKDIESTIQQKIKKHLKRYQDLL